MADFDSDNEQAAMDLMEGMRTEDATREHAQRALADADGKEFFVKVGAVLHAGTSVPSTAAAPAANRGA